MEIYDYPFRLKTNIGDCLLALGFFDGVHIAHRDLILRARDLAKDEGLRFGIFSFSARSSIKLGPGRIYSDEEKVEIFESLGADFTILADFGKIADMSAEDFVRRILIGELNCRIAVAGFNFKFGAGALGNAERLSELMNEGGGRALILNEIKDDNGASISASMIRNLIRDGRIDIANRYLGAPYNIKGRVLHGRAIGRSIGFPTVNIEIEDGRVLPKYGVYASMVEFCGESYLAITNVGECPTFDKRKAHLETNLFDFSGDLYGRMIRVHLLGFIREEMPFSSAIELSRQIEIDKNKVINEYGDKKWQELGLK